MTNSNKIKCRERVRAEPVICIKGNAHKLFSHSEFHAVRYSTEIARQVVELISVEINVVFVIILYKMSERHRVLMIKIAGSRSNCHHRGNGNGSVISR